MSTLIVLLPAREVIAVHGWDTQMFPFALVARNGGHEVEAGFAKLDALPKAASTVLIVAARDTLILHAALPPLQGERLRRALPNLVEDHLMRDAQHCHFALAPAARGETLRCIAVVERDWFAQVLERFFDAGCRRVRAVPLAQCVPLDDDDRACDSGDIPYEGTELQSVDDTARRPLTVLITPEFRPRPVADDTAIAATEPLEDRVELALLRGASGFGFNVSESQIDSTVGHFAQDNELTIYRLSYESAASVSNNALSSYRTLAWETLARSALACRFDLCQFEFGAGGRSVAAQLQRFRIPLALSALAIAVLVVTVNVQWLRLRHQRDALTEQMTMLVQEALPPGTVMLDPHAQMATHLARLRSTAGALRGDDFLTLSAALAHALGPIPPAALASMNYNGNALDVAFKPGTQVDHDAFARRLAEHGIAGHEEEGKWTLKPSPSGAH